MKILDHFLDFTIDVLVLLKLFLFNLYCYVEVLYKNTIFPKKQYKDIRGEIVLITGAGIF